MTQSASPHRAYISELDGLRFLAILAVLAVHYQPPNDPAWRWMSLGWCGVDLFFVLSGYLITNILLAMRGKPHPYKTFYWRRVLRIFPLYYGYLLLVAGLNRFQPLETFVRAGFFLTSVSPQPFLTILHRLTGQMSFAITALPIRDHLFDSPSYGLAMIWSLSVEELFYLFWAPIVLKRSRQFILGCAITPILVCPILRALAHKASYPEYFEFLFRSDALMFGAIVALAFAAVKSGTLRRETLHSAISVILTLPLLALFALAWQEGIFRKIEIRSTYSFALFGYTLCGLLFAGMVAWCIARTGSKTPFARVLRHSGITYIGKISYCMYLVHIYAFMAVYRIERHVFGHTWNPNIGTALLAALLTIGVASASWTFVESRFLRLKDRYFPSTASAVSAPIDG